MRTWTLSSKRMLPRAHTRHKPRKRSMFCTSVWFRILGFRGWGLEVGVRVERSTYCMSDWCQILGFRV